LRRGALGLAALALVAAGTYLVLGYNGSSARLAYTTDPLKRGDITVIVTATGTIEPTNKVEVSSELSGIVRTVAVDYNSVVKVGQVLAELDTDKLAATVESSRARLAAAEAHVLELEATVTETETLLARKQELADRRISPVQDLDLARAAHSRAVAALASARADVAAAKANLMLDATNLGKSCICSPIDGVVLDRNVEPGQVVASSLQAPTLFTIAEDLSKIEVQVDVDEADVGRVREGQHATFTVDAYPNLSFTATIRTLRYGAQVVQGVVTYKAVLSADNPDLLLRPGMTATAEITVEDLHDVLTVSNEALRFVPPQPEAQDNGGFLSQLLPRMPRFRSASTPEAAGPERRVWVLRSGAPQPVELRVGATDGRRTQVESGELTAGQEVIVDASLPAS
jgi:HlyD family secretion protein